MLYQQLLLTAYSKSYMVPTTTMNDL